MTTPAIELSDIACTFVSNDSGKLTQYTAVKGVNLTIGEGEFVSVVGPTGCGKSTLLNMSAGLLQPSCGTVKIFGKPLEGLNKRAGYMFQADSLMPWMSALDNVAAGLIFRGEPRERRMIRRGSGLSAWALPVLRKVTPTISPAACVSAWRWRRPSSWIRTSF